MNEALNKSVPFYLRFQAFRTIGLAMSLALGICACTSLPVPGGTSWKEEVLLHDDSKIIVKRSQRYGGRQEIGQSPPVKEHTISFALPSSGKTITWTSEYGEDIGRTNFNALALHVLDDTPYLVVEPNLCLSYNKLGRPNPPYVFWKFDGKSWQRVPLADFPTEFSTMNLVNNITREAEIKRLARESGYVSSDGVQQINSSLRQPEYRSILRDAIANAGGSSCGEMVGNGKGDWIGIGSFEVHPSLEACLSYCARHEFSAQYCPCNSLFRGE